MSDQNEAAQWNISLDCECPECRHAIDLFEDTQGLFEIISLIGEYNTPNSTDYEVECPLCGHEFKVDFIY